MKSKNSNNLLNSFITYNPRKLTVKFFIICKNSKNLKTIILRIIQFLRLHTSVHAHIWSRSKIDCWKREEKVKWICKESSGEIWCLNSKFQLITGGEKAARARFRIHPSKLHTPQDCTASLSSIRLSSFSIPPLSGGLARSGSRVPHGRPSLGRLAAEMPWIITTA